MKIRGSVQLFLAMMMIFSLFCCKIHWSPDFDTEGDKCYTHGPWWYNYYLQGLHCMELGEFENAISNFDKAIVQEKGKKDRWDARTYRMNFVDYFPNREMGISHYYLGEFEKTTINLETSLKQVPTAKTLLYLERAYQALLDPARIKNSSPRVTLELKLKTECPNKSVTLTRDKPVLLSALIKNEKYIKSISVNGEPVFLLNSIKDIEKQESDNSNELKTISFEKKLFLSEGEHTIRVESENVMGGIGENKVDIHIDRSGPMIVVTNKKWESIGPGEKKVIIRGFLKDKDSGLSEDISINNKNFSVVNGYFKGEVATKTDEVKLVAYDRLKNETSIQIPLQASFSSHKSVLLASAGLGTEVSNFYTQNNDTHPPEIDIKNLDDGKEVFLESEDMPFMINVDIHDSSNIDTVKINETKVLIEKGTDIAIHRYEILPQEDTTIEATDERGNKSIMIIKGMEGKGMSSQNRDDPILLASMILTAENNFISDARSPILLAQQVTIRPDWKISPSFRNDERLCFYVSPFFKIQDQKKDKDFQIELHKEIEKLKREEDVTARRFKVLGLPYISSLFTQPVNDISNLKSIWNFLGKQNRWQLLLDKGVECLITGTIRKGNTTIVSLDILEELKSYKGKYYKDEAELITALENKIKKQYVMLYKIPILMNAKCYYWLNDDSLYKLKKDKLPPNVFNWISANFKASFKITQDILNKASELNSKLSGLKAKEYTSCEQIKDDLKHIKDESIRSFIFLKISKICKNDNEAPFINQGLDAIILKINDLSDLKDRKYDNREEVEKGLQDKINDYDICSFVLNLLKIYKNKDDIEKDLKREMKKTGIEGDYNIWIKKILRAAEGNYYMDQKFLEQLNNTIIGNEYKLKVYDMDEHMNPLEQSYLNAYQEIIYSDEEEPAYLLAKALKVEFPFRKGEVKEYNMEERIARTTINEPNIKEGSKLLIYKLEESREIISRRIWAKKMPEAELDDSGMICKEVKISQNECNGIIKTGEHGVVTK